MSAVGEESLNRWKRLRNSNAPELYDFLYRDLDTAMALGAGARSDLLRVQLAWLIPLLEKECDGTKSPLIVEIGSGTGVAAAVVNLALGARVLAVDVHPSAKAITESVASTLGANVETMTGDANDLAEALAGRRPAACFLLSTVAWIQPRPELTPGYSWIKATARASAQARPTPTMTTLLDALGPACPVLESESAERPDYLGVLQACMATSGRNLVLATARPLRSITAGAHRFHMASCFHEDSPEPTAGELMSVLAGHMPRLRPGLVIGESDGVRQPGWDDYVRAELVRHQAVDAVQETCWEVTVAGQVERREVVRSGRLAIEYSSQVTGERESPCDARGRAWCAAPAPLGAGAKTQDAGFGRRDRGASRYLVVGLLRAKGAPSTSVPDKWPRHSLEVIDPTL